MAEVEQEGGNDEVEGRGGQMRRRNGNKRSGRWQGRKKGRKKR